MYAYNVPYTLQSIRKMRVARTMKWDLLYGPQKYQGFGLTNLHVYQGSMQLALLMQFYNTHNELSRLHNITVENLLMELGVTTIPFNLSYDACGACTTESWIKHIWKFCWEYKVTLSIRLPRFSPTEKK